MSFKNLESMFSQVFLTGIVCDNVSLKTKDDHFSCCTKQVLYAMRQDCEIRHSLTFGIVLNIREDMFSKKMSKNRMCVVLCFFILSFFLFKKSVFTVIIYISIYPLPDQIRQFSVCQIFGMQYIIYP